MSETPARTELPFVGYRKLRPGRIHFYCKKCGRKMSNLHRMEYDPPKAVLCQTWCPRCSEGCKELPEYYLDANGKEIRTW